MAVERDPYQVLGLPRSASLDDVKRAYRGLAKANHPDAAGEAALPRFLAIQAAYEQIAGSRPDRPGQARQPSRPSAADSDRAGATHRAYGARGRRPRPGAPPGGFPGGGWAAGTNGSASSGNAGARGGDAEAPRGSKASGEAGTAGRGPSGRQARPGNGAPGSPPFGAGTASGTRTTGSAAGGAHASDSAAGATNATGPEADGATDSHDASAADGASDPTGSGPRSTANDGPSAGFGAATGRKGTRRGRNKATFGSTSYDGVDATPFEPDWGGASWYGTTSGTYWTLNPKEYADPRKHGPEYQARARRTSRRSAGDPAAPPATSGADTQWGSAGTEAPGAEAASSSAPDDRDADGTTAAGRDASPKSGPMHTTSSWWDSTSGTTAEQPDSSAHTSAGKNDDAPPPAAPPPRYHATADGAAYATPASDPPDIGRALSELSRALLDDRTGGTRGRVVRAVVGWLPIAFGIGWLAGELTGCGRFAATCDGTADPFVVGLQIAMLGLLLAIPILAAVTTMATITLLVVASFVALVLSATGSAADDGSRRIALGSVLLISWLAGLVVAGARRVRSAPPSMPPARPVS